MGYSDCRRVGDTILTSIMGFFEDGEFDGVIFNSCLYVQKVINFGRCINSLLKQKCEVVSFKLAHHCLMSGDDVGKCPVLKQEYCLQKV